MDLSIIIVSHNTEKLTTQCLDSLLASNDTLEKEIIVVNNNSQDGTTATITENYPSVRLIQNDQNVGFARANNQAVEQASGAYILLLNSDTIVFPDTLVQFYTAVKRLNSTVASCMLLNPDKTIQAQGGSLPTLANLAMWMLFIDDIPFINQFVTPYQQRRKTFFESDRHMGWVGGTALMVDRKLYIQVGGLDESIFMYGEDVEFCLRMKQRGFTCDYFCKPKIIHLGQGSGTSANAIIGEYKGLMTLFKKHYSWMKLNIVKVLLIIGGLLRILVFGIMLRDESKKHIYKQAVAVARQ